MDFSLRRIGGAKRNPSFLWIYFGWVALCSTHPAVLGRGRGQRTYPNTVFELFFLLDQERAESIMTGAGRMRDTVPGRHADFYGNGFFQCFPCGGKTCGRRSNSERQAQEERGGYRQNRTGECRHVTGASPRRCPTRLRLRPSSPHPPIGQATFYTEEKAGASPF
jgi:hypothetical protein